MKKLLLWLWQLPQNLVGFIYSRFAKKTSEWYFKGKYAFVYFVPCFKAGVTLGQYIILDPIYKKLSSGKLLVTVQHEYGHSVQSKYLGWFYLLVVGIPSVFRNILNRINPKKFNEKWYYSGYPEKWADKIGGVTR
jgi:hypothetical protein